MPRYAFKEWAAVCRALAEGWQALILRKGGIAEEGGVFRPEHVRFWLYPTFVHQQADGIKPSAAPLLKTAEANRPPAEALRLTHFAEVAGTFFVRRLEDALALDNLHIWSEETVRKRFAYRDPGLYVLAVRVFGVPTAIEVPAKPEYDGCKTWVDLGVELPTDEAVPALEERAFGDVLEELERVL